MNKQYNPANLQKMYADAKWYMFVPLVGFVIYIIQMAKYSKEAGLMDKSTPGGAYMAKLTNNFFVFLNIFVPIWTLFVAVMFNFMFFFWRVKATKAIKMNKDANLYSK